MFISTHKVSEVEIFYRNEIPKSQRSKVRGSKDANEILKPYYKNHIEHFEAFKILMLNTNNEVLGIANISEGGSTGTLADIKIILQYAIKTHAHGLILSHNHPSGNLKPSEADKKITKKIKAAAELIDILLLDHIILTSDDFYSFGDNGIL